LADLTLEKHVGGLVAGIDEAGRGPWAGPVVAAAVIIDPRKISLEFAGKIDDSKKLSKPRREYIANHLKLFAKIGIGASGIKEIEKLNILQATLKAMQRAIYALPVEPDFALVDGNQIPSLPCAAKSIIKGDSISLSVAAASIVAKVTRDRIMHKLSMRYPDYGWDRNSGYGTSQHSKGLEKFGVTPHHRKMFAPIIKILSQNQ